MLSCCPSTRRAFSGLQQGTHRSILKRIADRSHFIGGFASDWPVGAYPDCWLSSSGSEFYAFQSHSSPPWPAPRIEPPRVEPDHLELRPARNERLASQRLSHNADVGNLCFQRTPIIVFDNVRPDLLDDFDRHRDWFRARPIGMIEHTRWRVVRYL